MVAVRTKGPRKPKSPGLRRSAHKMPGRKKEEPVYVPDHLDMVRMIAARGCSDKEMADLLGVPPKLLKTWIETYPGVANAIEEGRTDVDAEVLGAMFQRAMGYSQIEEKIYYDGEDEIQSRVTTNRHYPPEISAGKFWITNRQQEHWKDRQHTSVSGGRGDASPLGLRDETKEEVVASILSLIQPKDDNPVTIDSKTGKIIEKEDAPVRD